jgi:hypothetical protein
MVISEHSKDRRKHIQSESVDDGCIVRIDMCEEKECYQTN